MVLALAAPVFAQDNQEALTLDFANGLYIRKMYKPAVAEYEKFIAGFPQSSEIPAAKFRLADSYYFLKDYEKSAGLFQEFVKSHPQDERIQLAEFRLATAYYNLKNHTEAYNLFLALARGAKDVEMRGASLFYLSKVYEETGRPVKRATVLDRLIQNYPQSEYAAYAALMLGDQHWERKNKEAALQAFQFTAGRTDIPHLAREANLKIAEIFLEDGDLESARDYYLGVFEILLGESSVEAMSEENLSLLQKALLGVFYSDYRNKNEEASLALYETHAGTVALLPKRGEMYLLLAEMAVVKEKSEKALVFLDLLLAEETPDPGLREKALFKKAGVLASLKRPKEAVEVLETLLSAGPRNKPRAYFEMGELQRTLKRFPQALEAYGLVLKEPASDFTEPALFQSAVTHLELEAYEKAHAFFARFVADHPQSKVVDRAEVELIQLETDFKNYAEAASRAEAFLKAYPKSPLRDIALYKLGVARTALKEFEKAAASFGRIVEDYPDSALKAEAAYGAAVSFDHAGQYQEALGFYERFLELAPGHGLSKDARSRLGQLYLHTEDIPKAVEFYYTALTKDPGVEVSPDIAVWLVRSLLDAKDYARMRDILALLPERYPKEDLAHETAFFEGEAAMGAGEWEAATKHYAKAIDLDAQGAYVPHSYLGMGIAYAALERYDFAESNFEEALKFDFEVEVALRARFEAASLRLKAGELEEAAKGFMLVAILYDDEKYCSRALYHAGQCFEALKRPEDAAKARTELKDRFPKSEWAKKVT